MSGICGVVRLDGREVDPREIAAVTRRLAEVGPHGEGVWYEGPVGLGHRLFHDTPESVGETQPLTSRDGRLVITAAARIDNRDELFAALGVPPGERPPVPDGALILKTYERWGEACPSRLYGDWSFAVWDRRARKLFLARDHSGQTELAYHHRDGLFVFGSSIGALLALPDVPRQPNELEVARYLACLGNRSQDSFYDGIRFLCRAQAMTVTPSGVRVRRYWHPESLPELRLSSDDAYVEAFLDTYRRAVRCRLRSHAPVCVTLSGGLDSGSIASLAAEELAREGRRLAAYTWVYGPATHDYAISGSTDERTRANATAAKAGNIDVHLVRSGCLTPVESMERALAQTAEPRIRANGTNLFGTLDRAGRRGMGTLLIGQGGNQTVSRDGRVPYLWGLARAGRLWSLTREMLAWRSVHGSTLRRAMKTQVVRPLLALLPSTLGSRTEPGVHEASILNPELEREVDTYLSDVRLARVMLGTGEVRRGVFHSRQWSQGRRWPVHGKSGRVAVRDPTMDPRLVELCLSVPLDQWAGRGEDRRLMRRAMAGILPHQVAWNRARGLQATDVAWQLRNDEAVPELLGELEESNLARRFIDLVKLRQTFDELVAHGPRALSAERTKALHRGLSVGLFLRTLGQPTKL